MMFTNYPIQTVPSKHYPRSLREIPQKPKQLYIRGVPIDTTQRIIAVVGARRYSMYGKKACEKIIADLAPYPITIVSGLAIGIDAIAHQSALDAGLTTVAVIGSGLAEDTLYPSSNRTLARRILENGGTLISELDPKTFAARHTFPSRNRIMAGLAELVIAVECEERSGTRITTRLATDYNKEVGAIPHSVFSETGAGTNALIQQGAHIIRSGKDIADILGLDSTKKHNAGTNLSTLTREEQKVYTALTNPKTKTAIAQETNLPAHKLSAVLAGLEMKGLVTEIFGTVQRA